MKEFPAFLYVVRTNYGKVLASFVDSKFESTREMEIEANGKIHKYSKFTNNSIVFYYM